MTNLLLNSLLLFFTVKTIPVGLVQLREVNIISSFFALFGKKQILCSLVVKKLDERFVLPHLSSLFHIRTSHSISSLNL